MIRQARGFTLVELLVALVIFAIIASIVVMILSRVIVGTQQATTQLSRLRQLQWAFHTLEADFMQLVPGGKTEDTLALEVNTSVLRLRRQRHGKPEWICYRWQQHQLRRGGCDEHGTSRRLLAIDAMQLQFISPAGRVLSYWPPGQEQHHLLPVGIEMIITLPDGATIRRWFRLLQAQGQ